MAYKIIETCIGCTACVKRCPTSAITGARDQLHMIDPDLCIDCGACGHACPDGTKCNFGECTEQCSSPLKYCGQGCINPNTDKDNCGRCGNQCADDQRCEFGVCE